MTRNIFAKSFWSFTIILSIYIYLLDINNPITRNEVNNSNLTAQNIEFNLYNKSAIILSAKTDSVFSYQKSDILGFDNIKIESILNFDKIITLLFSEFNTYLPFNETRNNQIYYSQVSKYDVQRTISNSVSYRNCKINSISFNSKDLKISAKDIEINPGKISVFNTSLFNTITATELIIISRSNGNYFNIKTKSAIWNYPIGRIKLSNGIIYSKDNKPKTFNVCEIDSQNLKLYFKSSNYNYNNPKSKSPFNGFKSNLLKY